MKRNYDRDNELQTLVDEDALIASSGRFRLVALPGRRRVGETELIEQAMMRADVPFFVRIPSVSEAAH